MYTEPTFAFRDRADAGRKLAARLSKYQGTPSIVIGLPRGGVVVGYEIAKALRLELEVLVVRKIGHPENPELGIGALVEGGSPRLDTKVIRTLSIRPWELAQVLEREQEEAKRRVALYRQGRPFPDVRGRTVILVDDGIATGNTVRAAVADLRLRHPEKIVLAVAVAPPETLHDLRWAVDEVVCLSAPSDFAAVGQVYQKFEQVEDGTVLDLLHRVRAQATPHAAAPPGAAHA
jgi:putative phosphoribosyl transferase